MWALKEPIMRRTLIVLTLVSLGSGAVAADTWPKISTNSDGSQVYTYQNKTTCIKRADYATERTLSGKASIKQVFSAEGSSSQKVVDALAYSPSVSAVHAALFDLCTAYGSGAINKQQYDDERNILTKLQVAVIEKEAGQNPIVSQKTGPSQDANSKGSSSESPKEGAGSKTSQPSGAETKTSEEKQQSTEVKGGSVVKTEPKSSPESPKEGAGSKSSQPSGAETKTSEEKQQSKSAESTQPSDAASAKNEAANAKTVQPSNPIPTSMVPPQPPFPGGRDVSFNVKLTCSFLDEFGNYVDREKILRASLSFKADSKFESITQTCHSQAFRASGSWERIANSIAISVIVNNEVKSPYCTVEAADKLSCNLAALFPDAR
jgi:hypothetical protein